MTDGSASKSVPDDSIEVDFSPTGSGPAMSPAALNHVKAPVGDFRNWEAITTWAASVADALKTGDPGGSPGQ